MKTKTIFWDEHLSKLVDCPILARKSNTLEWFYIMDDGYFMLYHNVAI